MSTKSTIAHGRNFHLYHEALDEDYVYLELEGTKRDKKPESHYVQRDNGIAGCGPGPPDRNIVATARHLRCPLIMADEILQDGDWSIRFGSDSRHGFKHSAAIGEALAERVIDGKSKIYISSFSLKRFKDPIQ